MDRTVYQIENVFGGSVYMGQMIVRLEYIGSETKKSYLMSASRFSDGKHHWTQNIREAKVFAPNTLTKIGNRIYNLSTTSLQDHAGIL